MKEEIKELWKRCFDDNDEFVEMYFRLCYTDETVVVARSGGRIISSLQMPCYPMTFEGTEIQAAYISGACTHPGFRDKGVMAHLLAESFNRMVQKNIPISILIPANPALYGYYAKAGYASAFFRSEIKQQVPDSTAGKDNLYFEHITTFDQRLFDYFTGNASRRPNYVQHTAADFEAVMEDLCISKGSVTVATRHNSPGQEHASPGQIAGILFAYPEDGYLKIPEWFADNDSIRDNLFREAARHYQQSTIVRFELPSHSAGEEPFGMARIIHAKTILQQYAAAHPGKMINIHLTDEQLTFNSGYYYINKGICTFSPKALKSRHLELNAHELNTLIFNSIRLYMSLMLE